MNLQLQQVSRTSLGLKWHPVTTFLAGAFFVSVLAVKLSPLGLLVACLVLSYLSYRHCGVGGCITSLASPVFISIALLAVWMCVSALWSGNPHGAVQKGLTLLAILTAVAALSPISVSTRSLWYFGRDIAHTSLVISAFLAFEMLLGFPITSTVFRFVPKEIWSSNYASIRGDNIVISKVWASQQISMLMIVFWPALFVASNLTPATARKIVVSALVVTCFAAVFLSAKESAKAAFLCGAGGWIVAWYWPRWAILGTAAAWTAASLFVVPLMLLLAPAKLDQQTWVPESGRARFEIWQRISHYAVERPLLGVGGDSTNVEDKKRAENAKSASSGSSAGNDVEASAGSSPIRVRAHPHNMFLEIWYELGATGGAIVLAIGLFLLRELSKQGRLAQAFGIASLLSIAALGSLSHSIWQEWILAGMAWAWLALKVGVAMTRSQPDLERFSELERSAVQSELEGHR